MSTTGEASGSPCQTNSPCQKLAMRFETNVQKPVGVKIGWGHHSPNGLCVQPRCSVFASAPVKSPKLYLIHAIQQPATNTGGPGSRIMVGNSGPNLPATAKEP